MQKCITQVFVTNMEHLSKIQKCIFESSNIMVVTSNICYRFEKETHILVRLYKIQQ